MESSTFQCHNPECDYQEDVEWSMSDVVEKGTPVCPECGCDMVLVEGSVPTQIQERLEYLRQELRGGRISYGELFELQSLAPHIDKGDVELLEAAGVSEHEFDDRISLAQDLRELAVLLEDGSVDIFDGVARLGSLNSKWVNNVVPL